MGFSPLNRSNRSVSLPSRPNQTTHQFDEHVNSVRSLTISSSSSSSVTMSHKLAKLGDLYEFLDTLLLIPQNQLPPKNVDALLDGSVRLLEVCGNSREVLSQIKESLQDVQSALRRRSGGESSICAVAARYVGMRKMIEKVIRRRLKDVKFLTSQCGNFGSDNSKSILGMLTEVEAVSGEVFSSLLSYMARRNVVRSRSGSWSVVSKLLIQQEEVALFDGRSEFQDVDAAVSFFAEQAGGQRKKGSLVNMNVENLRNPIVKLESVVQEFDELLEVLFRRLVKTRSGLLNILSH